ncbi:hypothetical protein G6F54_014057 [Rhizopus delemar]|nr:hypothetical protein G6F54_014057 [Rhizopus delemar]
MAEIVGLAPVVGGGDDVPLVGIAIELGVAGPIELAVHDVVAELHVLQDLRQRQQQRAGDRGRPQQRHPEQRRERGQEQQATATDAEPAHGGGHAADVTGSGGAVAAEHTYSGHGR